MITGIIDRFKLFSAPATRKKVEKSHYVLFLTGAPDSNTACVRPINVYIIIIIIIIIITGLVAGQCSFAITMSLYIRM